MVSKRIVLHFPQDLIDKPVISNMVRQFDLEFNILKASITPEKEGLLVLELTGSPKNLEGALKYLDDLNIHRQDLSRDIIRDDDKCTHCGACVVVCPTEALYKDPETEEVKFESDKCIACELCVKACMYRAMQVKF